MNQRRGNNDWINPQLKRLNLAGEKRVDPGQDTYWSQIEESELTERIGKLVTEVNRAAGSHILSMVDFLPPQKSILRVSFIKGRFKHSMEILIRDSGIVLVFSTRKHAGIDWGRLFSVISLRNRSTVVWEQVIHPGQVVEQNIQAWLSYLLSGLDKKFRLDQMLLASLEHEAGLETALRKISA